MENKIAVIVVISLILIGGIVVYYLQEDSNIKNDKLGSRGERNLDIEKGNLEPDYNELNNVEEIFASEDMEEIRSYCIQNQIECQEYCKEEGSTSEFCVKLIARS